MTIVLDGSSLTIERLTAIARHRLLGVPLGQIFGASLAVGRTVAAILENYQNADGTVTYTHNGSATTTDSFTIFALTSQSLAPRASSRARREGRTRRLFS